MGNYVYVDRVRYVPVADAADASNLSSDYVARLCRAGKVPSTRVGKHWYVAEGAIESYLKSQHEKAQQRFDYLARKRRLEYHSASYPESEQTVIAKQIPPSSLVHKAALVGSQSVLHGVPAYVVHPAVEFLHKASALITAVALVFGTYAFADRESAQEVFTSVREHSAHVREIFTTDNLVRSIDTAHEAVARMITDPQIAQASRGAVVAAAGMSVEGLAKRWNAFVDSFIFDAMFTGTAVSQLPQSSTTQKPESRATSTPAKRASNTARPQYVVNQPVVERIVETQRVSVVGGISEAHLNERLDEIRNDYMQRILAAGSANTTYTSQVYNVVSQTNKIDNLGSVDISDSTITGGTITGATITGGSVTATAFDGVLPIGSGGTGTSSAPTYGKVLVGNSGGGYDLVATSSLGIGVGVSSPGGSDTNVQFNDGGLFGGDADFSYNKTTNLLSLAFGSSTALSSLDGVFVGRTSTTSILANATSTFAAGVQTTYLNVTGTAATSTFANGIRLSAGCFQMVDGSCAGTGSGAGFGQTWEISGGFLAPTTSTRVSLGQASSTLFSAHTLAVGQTATATISSAGVLTLPTALAVTSGGTGATSLNDLITLGTHTTGNYVATLSSSGSVTVGNSGSETAAVTVNLNMGNANTWTALQSFYGSASSTLLSAHQAYFGATATSSFSSAGVLTLAGSLNGPLHANAGVVAATSSILAIYGGTGQTSYSVGDILYASAAGTLSKLPIGGAGEVLKVSGGLPSWGTDLSSGGGAGGTWSTTTSQVSGTLINYPNNASDVVAIGSTATTAAEYWFDPNTTTSFFSGNAGFGTTSPYARITAWGSGSLFEAVNTSSSTIFSIGQTGATTTNFGVSGSASTSNLTVSNTFTLRGLTGFLKATAGVVATAAIDLASDVTGILGVSNGGTGWANIQANSLVLGNGTGAIATTSAGTNGQVLALVSGVPTWVATTTLSTITGTLSVDKGGTGAASLSSGQLVYGAGTGAVQTVATSSIAVGSSLAASGTLGYQVGGTNVTLSLNTGNANTWTALQTFANASTTLLSSLDTVYVGRTATTTIRGDGVASTLPFASTTMITATTASTTNLVVSSAGGSGTRCLQVAADGTVSANASACGTAGLSSYDAWTHPSAGVSATTSGIIITASSTIGTGAQTGGLTISGGATTTGSAYIAGNLGIGTAGPAYKLDVSGSFNANTGSAYVNVNGSTVATYGAVTNMYTNGANTIAIQHGFELPTSIQGYNDGTYAVLLQKNGGKVGVGTTSPYAKLAIQATGGQTNPVFEVASSSNATKFLSVAGDGFGTTTVTGLTINGSATTTSNVGILLSSGCFATAGGCVTPIGSSSIEDLNDVAAMTENYGDLLYWNGSAWADIATSSLNLSVTALASADFGDWTCNGSACTVDADAITLATDTTGNYVATVSSSGSVTVGNSGTENAGVTVNLNMGNANTWTALQTFANASTTALSCLGNCAFGSTATSSFASNGTLSISGGLNPLSSDGAALGTASLMWSDLFLADGSVVNFNNGDVTLTHSANTLTLGGGNLALGANNLTLSGTITSTSNAANAIPFASTTMVTATTASSTNLWISSIVSGSLLKTTTGGQVTAAVAGTDYASASSVFGKSWEIASGALAPTTTLGILVSASSTIGSGAQAGGLTISGGATTTGNHLVSGALTVAGQTTLATSLTGLLKATSGVVSAASAGSDYVAGSSGSSNRVAYWSSASTITSDADLAFDGTTLTARDLLVQHTAPILSINDSDSTGTDFRLDVNDGQAVFAADIGAGLSGEFFSWSTNNAEKMRLLENGLLGVGTSTPVIGQLTVSSTTGSQLALSAGAGLNQWAFRNAGGNLYVATTTVAGTATTSTSALTILSSSGNVGVGTASPGALLHVTGINDGDFGAEFYNNSATGFGLYAYVNNNSSTLDALRIETTAGQIVNVKTNGNFGIGTTTPWRKLSITDAVSTAQQVIAYDTTRYTSFLTDSVGDLTIDPQGGDAFLNDDNLWVCTGGSCPSGTIAGTGNIVAETALGVSTSTPVYPLTAFSTTEMQLSLSSGAGIAQWGARNAGGNLYFATTTVAGDATTTLPALTIIGSTGFTGIGTSSPTQMFSVKDRLFVGANGATTLGTATSTFQGDIKITGKLDVSTIDPPYTIDGVKYATYVPSMTGVKEETTMTVQLETYNAASKKYETTIDFDDVEEGSDLWLFYQIVTFGENWKDLVVQLTPSFDGTVFYQKQVAQNSLTISGDFKGEVSVRLTANRYDTEKWPNLRPDQDGNTEGTHVISSKSNGRATALSATATAAVERFFARLR